LYERVPDGLGSAGVHHLGDAVHLHSTDRRSHLRLFAHLSGGLAQRAVQPCRVARRPTFVVGRRRGGLESGGWTSSTHRARQSGDVDDRLGGQGEDREADAGRGRELRHLLRTVVLGADVGRLGRRRAV